MRRLLVLGLVLYVVFVARQFPADVAVAWFVPEPAVVHGATGTLWSGQARAIDTGRPGLLLGETRWRVRPLWLLLGRLRGEFNTRFQDSAVRTGFSASLLGSSLTLFDTSGIVALDTLPPNLLPQRARGRVGVTFERLRLVDGWPRAVEGSVDLVDFEVAQGRRVALGSFEVLFDGSADTDEAVVGTVTDTDSSISVNGTLALGAERSYLFEGDVKAGGDTPKEVAEALQFLGNPSPDGSVAVSFSGTLD